MDVYHSPEKFGLTTFGEIEFEGGYEHDKIAVWRDGQGQFLYGHSQGCSCVGIFENTGYSDLSTGTPNEILAVIRKHIADRGTHRDYMVESWNMEAVALYERMVSP